MLKIHPFVEDGNTIVKFLNGFDHCITLISLLTRSAGDSGGGPRKQLLAEEGIVLGPQEAKELDIPKSWPVIGSVAQAPRLTESTRVPLSLSNPRSYPRRISVE